MVKPADPGGNWKHNATDEYQTCPNCALPHKMDDTVCSFCGSKLLRRVTLAEKIRRAAERLKWRYKLKTRRKNPTKLAKEVSSKFMMVALGVLLSSVGAWFVLRAGDTGAMSDYLLGALFLIYGVYAVYNPVKPS